MHQYKVHLPQRNSWDHEDNNMMETFFMSGINRDSHREDVEDAIDLDNNLDLDKN